MPMSLATPAWLLLVPLLVAAGWQWRALGLGRPLRAACLGLVVLLLADPQVRWRSDGLDLWLLVDRSDSAAEELTPRLREWESLLAGSRGPDDRIMAVDFAAEAVPRGALLRAGSGGTEYAGARNATRLRSAITRALAGADPDRATRFLAFTDGYSTEPLSGVADKLLERGIALDLRLPPPRGGTDFSIARLDLPHRAQPREALLVGVTVQGTVDGRVPLEVQRDGVVIGTLDVDVVDGLGQVRFSDRLSGAGAHRYDVRVLPREDARPGNDGAGGWVEIDGGRRVLLVTSLIDDPLVAVLRRQGLEVEVIDDPARARVGALAGSAAVILNDVPAARLDAGFIAGLPLHVEAQGRGLAMIGGRYSFASGGWARSPLDPLLPVDMELKQEQRKLSVALAIVIDRSGSMTATAGSTGLTKIELAGEGAARAIELLGKADLVALIPVDSAAHPITPKPVPVATQRDDLARAARRLVSEGGGIFCYQGLSAAWEMLRDVTVGQRHVILFADAADAEEPGDYKTLLAQMAAQNCTVSVIGMGSRSDRDAALLDDIAARGGGRIFYSADGSDLPALFQMETTTVARSAFLTDPVAVLGTPGWLELATEPLEWPAQVDAFNMTSLRPGASVAALTGDEDAAPLVAFWQRGTGRVAAVTCPLGGPHSDAVRGWPGYADMASALARWLMGPEPPAGIGLRARVDGTEVRFDLYHDDTWNEQLAAAAPRLTVAAGSTGAARPIPWERLSPGHYSAAVDAADVDYVRAGVGIGAGALAVGPIGVTTNPEWTPDPRRLAELRGVAGRSGGGEVVDLTDVWSAPRPPAWQSLRRWLLPLLALAILADALATQTGWRWPKGRDPR